MLYIIGDVMEKNHEEIMFDNADSEIVCLLRRKYCSSVPTPVQ